MAVDYVHQFALLVLLNLNRKVSKINKILVVDPEKCTGCRLCELVCSAFHEKTFSPIKSRIHVIKWDEKAIDVPMVCQHCSKPVCVEICPTNALYKDAKSEIVVVDETRCIGCKVCVLSCPFGAISWDIERGKILKCDLCDGDPQCVKICKFDALKYVKADKVTLLRKREGAKKLSELVSLIVGEGFYARG